MLGGRRWLLKSCDSNFDFFKDWRRGSWLDDGDEIHLRHPTRSPCHHTVSHFIEMRHCTAVHVVMWHETVDGERVALSLHVLMVVSTVSLLTSHWCLSKATSVGVRFLQTDIVCRYSVRPSLRTCMQCYLEPTMTSLFPFELWFLSAVHIFLIVVYFFVKIFLINRPLFMEKKYLFVSC